MMHYIFGHQSICFFLQISQLWINQGTFSNLFVTDLTKVIALTYLNVDGCVAVHPHRKHSILEHYSDLIQKVLLQCSAV